MNWKDTLQRLEEHKEWDLATAFMQDVINQYPSDIDVYLNMNYLLMNLLVEEDYDPEKHDYYANLLKKYFKESYLKFYQNAEYLFFSAITAFLSEWYFDIAIDEARKMFKKALLLEPENILYRWGYYAYLDMANIENKKQAVPYAYSILAEKSPEKKILLSKGSLGRYILGIMESWIKE